MHLRKIVELARGQFFLKSSRGRLGVLGAFLLLFVFCLFSALSEKSFVVIYDKLKPEESAVLAKSFKSQGVPFRISQDGTQVLVPPESIKEATMALALGGMSFKEQPGLELLDKSQFGKSSYIQRINYYRALQGELSRVVATLKNVDSSYIMIRVPRKKAFLRPEHPIKANIVLNVKKGKRLGLEEINGIYLLAENSVEGLKKENVTIVDQSGRLLGSQERVDQDSLNQLRMKEYLEAEYEERITEILTPLFGLKNVIVNVNAEMSKQKLSNADHSVKFSQKVHNGSIRLANFSVASKPSSSNFFSGHNLPHVERLKVAVLLNTPENEKRVPASKEKILKLIQGSVSLVEGRDQLMVETLAFAPVDQEDKAGAMGALGFNRESLYSYLKIFSATLFFVLLLILAFRPLFHWIFQNSKFKSHSKAYPVTVSELEAQYKVIDENVAVSSKEHSFSAMEVYKQRLVRLVEEDPHRAARLMSKWIFQSMSRNNRVPPEDKHSEKLSRQEERI